MPSRCKVITRIELPPKACLSIALTNTLGELGDVARYAPSLVQCENVGYVSIRFCLAAIDGWTVSRLCRRLSCLSL
jgi:hypothetical protein